MKILLIVDDNPMVRKSLRRNFQTRGFDVKEAGSGGEALRLVRDGLKPDVILSDVDMPEMSGIELARARSREFPEIPMILCSGGGHEKAAEELGVAYFAKGGDVAELRSIVFTAAGLE